MIRPAAVADAQAIAALEAVLFGAEGWSSAQVAEELTGFGRRGWVVETAQAASCVGEADWPHLHRSPAPHSVVAYVITRTVGEVSDLQRIGVAPSRQRAGLAAALLAEARHHVREEGAERILLEVAEDNAAARAFYARAGFVEIDRRPRYYRQEVAALVLELVLARGLEE